MADDIRFDIILDDAKAQRALKVFSESLKVAVKSTKGFGAAFRGATKAVKKLNKELTVSNSLMKRMSKDLKALAMIASKLPKNTAKQAKQMGKVAAATTKTNKALKNTSKRSKKVTQNFRNQAAAAAQVSSGLKGGLALLLRYGPAAAAAAVGIAGIAAGVRGFTNIVKAGIESEDALVGLRSVAKNTGVDMDAASDAAKRFASEGLIGLKDSATSLKNLLAKGFDLDQSVKLIEALRDSAAFGKQAHLEFGEAIAGATEGIKNDNSVKSDNAGITENLSIMHKRFAKQLGKTVGQLTEAEKRQGVFNGILREGRFFADNFNIKLQTFSGLLGLASSRAGLLAAELGTMFTSSPAVLAVLKSLVGGVGSFSSAVKDNKKEIGTFIKKSVILLLKSFSGLIKGLQIASMAWRAFSGVLLDVGGVLISVFDWHIKQARFLTTVYKKALAIATGGITKYADAMADGEKKQLRFARAAAAYHGNQKKVDEINKKLKESSGDYLTSLEAVRSEYTQLQKDFEQGAENFLAPAEAGIENFSTALDGIAEKIEAMPDIDIKIKGPTGKVKAPKGAGAGAGAGGATEKGFLDEFGSSVSQFTSAILGFIKNTSDQEDLTKVQEESSTISDTITELEKALKDATDPDERIALEQKIAKERLNLERSNAKVLSTQTKNANKENARGFITAASTGIADALAPGLGQVVGPLIAAATQGADAVEEQFGGMVDALPEVILALADALPVIIEVLIERSPEIAAAIVQAFFRLGANIWTRVIEVVTKSVSDFFREFFNVFLRDMGIALGGMFMSLVELILKPFRDIEGSFKQLFAPFDAFAEAVGTVTDTFATFKFPKVGGSTASAGEKTKGFVKKVTSSLGFATGGMVKGSGNRDTVPAVLSPGELVVDRTTGPKLLDFIDTFPKGNQGGSDPVVAGLLAQLLEAVKSDPSSEPTTIQLTLDGAVLAEEILNLNNNNSRLT